MDGFYDLQEQKIAESCLLKDLGHVWVLHALAAVVASHSRYFRIVKVVFPMNVRSIEEHDQNRFGFNATMPLR